MSSESFHGSDMKCVEGLVSAGGLIISRDWFLRTLALSMDFSSPQKNS